MNKTLTNQWIDQQAQSLGLKIGYVKTGNIKQDIRIIFIKIRKRLLKPKTFLFDGGTRRDEVMEREGESEIARLHKKSGTPGCPDETWLGTLAQGQER